MLMDLLEIKDWHIFNSQPPEIIQRRIQLLERRGLYEQKQRDRIGRGPGAHRAPAKKISRPPDDIQQA